MKNRRISEVTLRYVGIRCVDLEVIFDDGARTFLTSFTSEDDALKALHGLRSRTMGAAA